MYQNFALELKQKNKNNLRLSINLDDLKSLYNFFALFQVYKEENVNDSIQ